MKVSALVHTVELSRQPGAARRELTDLLLGSRWNGDIEAVVLATHEAMVNSNRHGGGVTRAAAGLDGAHLVVEVCDHGHGFDFPKSPEVPDIGAERGRGLYLIGQLSTDAVVVRAGGEVRLVLRFKG